MRKIARSNLIALLFGRHLFLFSTTRFTATYYAFLKVSEREGVTDTNNYGSDITNYGADIINYENRQVRISLIMRTESP